MRTTAIHHHLIDAEATLRDIRDVARRATPASDASRALVAQAHDALADASMVDGLPDLDDVADLVQKALEEEAVSPANVLAVSALIDVLREVERARCLCDTPTW